MCAWATADRTARLVAMRSLTVLALLGAVACGPAQRDRPATVVAAAIETEVAAVSTPTVSLGDLDALEPTPPASAERAKAKAAVAGQREFAQPVVPPEETVVRVLLYHGIGPSSSRESVKTRAFREQIEWLGAHGIEVIRLSQLLEFLDRELWLPRHAVVITIDDGESNGYSTAYPLLKARGLPFTLGIATQVIDEHRRRGALDWGQIREMVDSG